MNKVLLIGRVTRDLELKGTDRPYTRFSIGINRPGQDKGADFPNIVVFGKQAENAVKYLAKGRLVAIEGRLQTGSYEKDGVKIYTTDVIADRVEFLEWGERKEEAKPSNDFAQINEDVPWA